MRCNINPGLRDTMRSGKCMHLHMQHFDISYTVREEGGTEGEEEGRKVKRRDGKEEIDVCLDMACDSAVLAELRAL